MNGQADKVWSFLDRIAGASYSAKIRPFLTMGWMTAFALVLFLVAGLSKALLPHAPPLPIQVRIEHIFGRPLLIVPYDLASLLVIWFLIRSQPRPEHLYLRTLLYGMFLAGFLASLLVLFVPWRG